MLVHVSHRRIFAVGIRIAQPQPWRPRQGLLLRYAVHCFEVFENKQFTVGLLHAVLVCPRLGWSCLSLVGRSGLVFSVFRLFRLVFLGSLSDGLGFDSCSLCDFTACIGMSLPSACSFVFLHLYAAYAVRCLSLVETVFFYGPTWRVTNNTTPRFWVSNFLGVQSPMAHVFHLV